MGKRAYPYFFPGDEAGAAPALTWPFSPSQPRPRTRENKEKSTPWDGATHKGT
ncbi:hypothetical protein HMPREF0970_01676 [Schaalia odontolytica F0309]|uniref:Uncharacterized protein n=1 Tax=Schaalia odontolytica F0309 TaxID=649742 RepID=D4U0D4_9ACTO|nr:hypothetical protein HMPREF0970_01676 [Schaalia odontolytica F0309]